MLTDVVMPDMPGSELARRLRERAPDLRVLFMSSYAHDHVAVRGVPAEGVYFIEKRFDLDALLAAAEPGALPARTGGSSSKRG